MRWPLPDVLGAGARLDRAVAVDGDLGLVARAGMRGHEACEPTAEAAPQHARSARRSRCRRCPSRSDSAPHAVASRAGARSLFQIARATPADRRRRRLSDLVEHQLLGERCPAAMPGGAHRPRRDRREARRPRGSTAMSSEVVPARTGSALPRHRRATPTPPARACDLAAHRPAVGREAHVDARVRWSDGRLPVSVWCSAARSTNR